jgi:alkylated DNA repair protein alkB family protein 8
MRDRTVVHFGKIFDYTTKTMRLGCGPFPGCALEMIERYRNIMNDFKSNTSDSVVFEDMDQLTVNCYEPGSGIAPHVDTHTSIGETILLFSFGSDVIMEFTTSSEESTRDVVEVLIPSRSMVIMTGDSRYGWTHGIRSRTFDVVNGEMKHRKARVSFTFRKEKIVSGCICSFPHFCDDRHL